MIEIKNFKEQYYIVENLKSIVGKAFNQIKDNPSLYRAWEHGNYYRVVVNDILVSLLLLDDDFNLSDGDYNNQLNTLNL